MNYKTSLEKKALLISAFTHPLLMPLFAFLLLNHYNSISFHGQSFYILLLVFSITVIGLPVYFVFALKRSGYIQTIEMETLKERRLPLIFTCVTMVFNYYLMQRASLPQPFLLFFLSLSIASLIAMVISVFYKISLHMLGVGYLFGLGLLLSNLSSSDMRYYMMLISILCGVVATCRLLLKAHSLPQLYLGFIVGVCSAWSVLVAL